MQRDHVRLREYLVVRGEGHSLHLGRRMIGEQHAHTECAPDRRRALADGALADDAERGSVQIADVVGEEAELVGLVPNAILDILAVREQIAPQSQNHREGMFGYGMHRVVADVGDRDAVFPAIRRVNHIVAGCRHGDHLQLRQLP